MSKGWTLVIAITIIVAIVFSAIQIYSTFTSKNENIASVQITPIEKVLNTEVVDFVKKKDSVVVVKSKDIEPATTIE